MDSNPLWLDRNSLYANEASSLKKCIGKRCLVLIEILLWKKSLFWPINWACIKLLHTTKLCMQSSSIYSFNVISSKDNRKIIGPIYWIFEACFFHFSTPQHLTISTIVYEIGMQLFYSKTIYVLNSNFYLPISREEKNVQSIKNVQ